MYQPRTYRHWVNNTSLATFEITVRETDLKISANRDLREEAYHSTQKHRDAIEHYISSHPAFLTSLQPYHVEHDAPKIIKEMAEASRTVSLGPMAAVAGAIAEFVGKDLLSFSDEVIVENGGDIFIQSAQTRKVGIYAGSSPLSGRLALQLEANQMPVGICTSSGTVGHSLSMGQADAVVILAPSTALADAVATAVGNLVVSATDIEKGIKLAEMVNGVTGIIIIKDDKMGLWGDVKIVKI